MVTVLTLLSCFNF